MKFVSHVPALQYDEDLCKEKFVGYQIFRQLCHSILILWYLELNRVAYLVKDYPCFENRSEINIIQYYSKNFYLRRASVIIIILSEYSWSEI